MMICLFCPMFIINLHSELLDLLDVAPWISRPSLSVVRPQIRISIFISSAAMLGAVMNKEWKFQQTNQEFDFHLLYGTLCPNINMGKKRTRLWERANSKSKALKAVKFMLVIWGWHLIKLFSRSHIACLFQKLLEVLSESAENFGMRNWECMSNNNILVKEKQKNKSEIHYGK